MTDETEAEKRFLYRQAKHEILQGGSIVFLDELKSPKNPTEAQEIENANTKTQIR